MRQQKIFLHVRMTKFFLLPIQSQRSWCWKIGVVWQQSGTQRFSMPISSAWWSQEPREAAQADSVCVLCVHKMANRRTKHWGDSFSKWNYREAGSCFLVRPATASPQAHQRRENEKGKRRPEEVPLQWIPDFPQLTLWCHQTGTNVSKA